MQNPDAFNSWSLKLPQEAAQTQFIYLSVVSYLFIQLFKTEMIANGQKIKIGDWFDGVIWVIENLNYMVLYPQVLPLSTIKPSQ